MEAWLPARYEAYATNPGPQGGPAPTPIAASPRALHSKPPDWPWIQQIFIMSDTYLTPAGPWCLVTCDAELPGAAE